MVKRGRIIPAMVPRGGGMAEEQEYEQEQPMTCPECLGTGYLTCPTCDGQGSVESKGDEVSEVSDE
jgi:DnaJ-class molecular chaperone